jgi:hypothetical protein
MVSSSSPHSKTKEEKRDEEASKVTRTGTSAEEELSTENEI